MTTIKATKVKKASNPQVKEAKVEKTVAVAKAKTTKKVKKKVELPATKLEKKKIKIAKEVTPVTNTALMEAVISKREIKYIYPEDCLDTLARKQFRQKVRNNIKKMENQLFKIGDKNAPEYIKIFKDLTRYKKANVKMGAAV